MQRILRFLTFFVMFVVGTNAWSVGYVCTELMTYTSCSNGYYVSDCGASSNWSGQTLTESDVSLGNTCESCPAGYTCTGGLACPTKSSTQSGYLCDDAKRYVSCPAGEYLSDCGDSSNWVGQTLDKSELAIGNACVSCPDGLFCAGGATCPVGDVEWKATVYTKSTSSFYFSIRAAGTFYVDWGDGHIEVQSADDADEYLDWSHDYDDDQVREIKIGGLATGYSDEDSFTVISFSDNGDIDSISGSLGAIFPTLADGTQPMFNNAFYQSNLRTISADLLTGIHGQARQGMFGYMFYDTMLEEIPDGLFDGLDGIAVPNLFEGTFSRTNVEEIPVGLFDMFADLTSIPDTMFDSTFRISPLTGPAAKMSDGRFLHEIWPMTGYSMYTYARTNIDNLDYIPSSWGGGGHRAPTFTITTTEGTNSFEVGIFAAGQFTVDWGDGSDIAVFDNDTVDGQRQSHTYATAGAYTIKIGGLATEYDTSKYGGDYPVIGLDAKKIKTVSGSLTSIFPTLEDGSQPSFFATFDGATNLTSVPDTLFSGLTGAPVDGMFAETFTRSGLTSIPEGLFGDITGAADYMFVRTFNGCTGLTEIPADLFSGVTGAADGMFSGTFEGCTGLTEIPDGLFSGITGAADYMFYSTFYGCTNLTSIPADLFSGVTGAADGMFEETFYGCTNLTSIPDGLFDGVYGVETLPSSMFYGTFNDCTALTGPAAKMSAAKGGKYLHEIWPMTESSMDTYANATGLDDWDYIQTSWGGGGYFDCAAGTYLAANTKTCSKCLAGNYCPGIKHVTTSTEKQGINACPAGYTSGNATGLAGEVDCFGGYKFTLTTTADTSYFEFMIGAAGKFWVDWGDGNVGSYPSSGTVVPYHRYASAGEYTIKLGGLATSHSISDIGFNLFPERIAAVSGSLGAIFPTLSDGSVPSFQKLFQGATNLTEIPATLFSGVTGATRDYMFMNAFEGSGLTSIPDGLFDGLDQSKGLKITTFAATFKNCASLKGPAAKMSAAKGGKYLHEIWPMSEVSMGTYTGSRGLDNWIDIPLSWGGGGGKTVCEPGYYLRGGAQECDICLAGSYCPGGELIPSMTQMVGIYTCPAGSYCPAGSDTPTACPSGYTSGDATGLAGEVGCFGGYKFELTTTADTDFVEFMLGAAGKFWVDWGDGEVQEIVRETAEVGQLVSHIYASAGQRTVRIGGLATGYGSGSAVVFWKSTLNNSYTFKIASISGSLGAIFPTLADGSVPRFYLTFYGATNMTSIPAGLFSGVSGAVDGMFEETFKGCTGLSSIPAGLFSGVSGAAASMFEETFEGCTGLTKIPDGLFDGVAGAETLPENMFYRTFYNDSALTGPAAKMSAAKGGKYLHEIWPMDDVRWETYTGATGLTDWVDIPLSWGGAGRISCAAGQYIAKGGSTCTTCKAGYYCPGGDLIPSTTADVGLTTCPAGSYCVAESTEPMACPAGYTSGNATGLAGEVDCFGGYKFEIKTTDDLTGEFSFSMISVKGKFWVDWGDDSEPEHISLTDFTGKTITHNYATAGKRTIKFGGLATEYNTTATAWGSGIIKFQSNPYVSKLSGSLGAIFPTLADGSQPGFMLAFAGNSNLTEIPAELFDGISGQARTEMFMNTFAGCAKLTEIPAELFSGITGAAEAMFNATFAGCISLTEIPAGLFSGITGAAGGMFANTFNSCPGLTSIPDGLFDGVAGTETLPTDMFYRTFYDNTSLTGPAAKMSAAKGGKFLHEIWPMDDVTWETYTGATKLDNWEYIPTSWGGGGILSKLAPNQYYDVATETVKTGCPAGYYCPGENVRADATPVDGMLGLYSCKAFNENYTSDANTVLPMAEETADAETVANIKQIMTDAGLDASVAKFGCYANVPAGSYKNGSWTAATLETCPAGTWSGAHRSYMTIVTTDAECNACPAGYTSGNATGLTGVADCFGGYKFELNTVANTNSFDITMNHVAGTFYIDWGDGVVEVQSREPGDAMAAITWTHTYDATGEYTIKIGGLATKYGVGRYVGTIVFDSSAFIESISGSLGAIFPTLDDGSQPVFINTFMNATSLTEVPGDLFAGVTGAPCYRMFLGTFSYSGLTQIPAELFSGISGAPAQNMFENTFSGCTALESIPVGLFDGLDVTKPAACYMFSSTFESCTSLTGEAARMSDNRGGKYLHEIWPMGDSMAACPMMQTYANATGLDDWDYIPSSWGGGGQIITCAAGTYLPANATACVTCTAGNYCAGLTGVVPSDAKQGINACPAGYTNSADGAVNVGWCYMNLAAGYHVGNGGGYSQMLHEKTYHGWSEDQAVYYGHYSAVNFCPTNMHNGTMDYENTELFDSEYDACYKKYSGQIVEKVIPMVKSIKFDSLDFHRNFSAINVDDIYVYVDDGNGAERKLSQDELKSYLSNEDEFAAWFDGQYATPIELTSATLNFNTALPIVRVGVRIYADRNIGYQSDTGGWNSNHLKITLTDSDDKTGIHSYYGLRDSGVTASLTYGTPGPVHTFPTVYYAQKACPSGTYKEEYVARVNTTYTCDACVPAPDGGVVASVAPYDAPTTCYVPAHSEMKDSNGTYVFIDSCMYK